MKTLVAIYTCHRYDYHHDMMKDWLKRPVVDRVSAVRDTWVKDLTVDYKFFYGDVPKGVSKEPLSDEVFLKCPDGYYALCHKTKALVRWALENGYDRILKVDDDIFVHWERMVLSQGFTVGSYVGGGFDNKDIYAAGGCYWLDRDAMEVLSSAPVGASEWAEDRWAGLALARQNVKLQFDPSYYYQRALESTRLQYIEDSLLYSDHKYTILHALTPEQMREYYGKHHTAPLGG
jgi:hypothetical protein